MKVAKLFTICAVVSTFFASCGSNNGGWREVSQKEFIADITAIPNENYFMAHVVGSWAYSVSVTSSGEDWETVQSIAGYTINDTSEEGFVEFDDNYHYGLSTGDQRPHWLLTDDSAEGPHMGEYLEQKNTKAAWAEIIPNTEMVSNNHFFIGDGFKCSIDMRGEGFTNQKGTIKLDEKAYIVKYDVTATSTTVYDYSAQGFDAVMTLATYSDMHFSVEYNSPARFNSF